MVNNTTRRNRDWEKMEGVYTHIGNVVIYHHNQMILTLSQDEMCVIINDNLSHTYSVSVVGRQSVDGLKEIIGCNQLEIKALQSGRLSGFEVVYDADQSGPTFDEDQRRGGITRGRNHIATGILLFSGLEREEFRGTVIIQKGSYESNEISPSDSNSEQ